MGQGIDFLCKLYCQDSQCHVDIHLFELQKKYLSFYKIIIFLIYIELSLLGTHLLYGSPVSPGGHLQLALWLSTVHSALVPHGLSTLQGLTQALFLQA